jgi:hypothetical protein
LYSPHFPISPFANYGIWGGIDNFPDTVQHIAYFKGSIDLNCGLGFCASSKLSNNSCSWIFPVNKVTYLEYICKNNLVMYGEAKKLHLIEEILRIEDEQILNEVETVITRGKVVAMPIRKSFKDFAGLISDDEVNELEKIIEKGKLFPSANWIKIG